MATTVGQRLDAAAADLYGDLPLTPVLQHLLRHSGLLLRAAAGSVSLVDEPRRSYAKVAEHGARCRLGQRFPLDEGVTGRVVERRGPVVLERYSDLAVGHLSTDGVASRGAAVAVPLWWRGEVVGANVVFACRRRRFTSAEVDGLEVLTQLAVPAVVRARDAEQSLAHLLRGPGAERGARPARVTEVGPARPVSARVAALAVEMVGTAARVDGAHADRLHVAVVHRPEGLRLLIQDGTVASGSCADPLGLGALSWQGLVEAAGGGLHVEHVPGWGTLVRADLPYAAPMAPPPPLTPREREVLALLGRGLADRDVAAALVVSRKTVEKHVAAILRKTGTASRTAAVVRALERGWLPAPVERTAQDG